MKYILPIRKTEIITDEYSIKINPLEDSIEIEITDLVEKMVEESLPSFPVVNPGVPVNLVGSHISGNTYYNNIKDMPSRPNLSDYTSVEVPPTKPISPLRSRIVTQKIIGGRKPFIVSKQKPIDMGKAYNELRTRGKVVYTKEDSKTLTDFILEDKD